MAGKNVEGAGKIVKELFKDEVVYSMPEFQRGYVWEEKHLQDYWKDLKKLIELEKKPNETSFLGALVLQEASSRGGNKTEGPPARYIVIDGQQRLTTFYLTLLALLVYATERVRGLQEQEDKGKAEDVEKGDLDGWVNYADSVQHKNYLFSHEPSNPGEVKLKPSRNDHSQFSSILSELKKGLALGILEGKKSPKLLSTGRQEFGKLFNAYQSLQGKIQFFIDGKKKDALEQEDVYSKIEQRKRYDKIFQALVEGTEVVQIITKPHLLPNEIFDRLNTKGVPLGTLDWVRNDIYGRLPVDEDDKELPGYRDFSTAIWGPFENDLKKVSKVTDMRPLKGKSDKEKENEKEKRKEKRGENQSKLFFKAYGVITQGSKFKVGEQFRCLKEDWDKKIDTRDYPQQYHYRYGDAEVIVKDLEEHLPSYLALCAGKKPVRINLELWKLIESMKELSFPELTYPFLMPVIRSSMKGELPVDNAIQAFKIVESFLVRRVFAGQDSSGLSRVFKNLWARCKKENMTPALILQSIKKSARSGFYEDDDAVKRNILTESVYEKEGVRYILMQYEEMFRENRPALEPPLHECHIDHIMPQAESKLGEAKVSPEEAERARLCATLGNLTLLDPGINLRKSSKELKKEVKKDPRSAMGLLEQSHLHSVKDLLDDFDKGEPNSWGVNSIKNRGDKLGKWAVERWPLTPEKF